MIYILSLLIENKRLELFEFMNSTYKDYRKKINKLGAFNNKLMYFSVLIFVKPADLRKKKIKALEQKIQELQNTQ